MHTLLVVFHVLVAAGLIGLVLVQHGKGADAGAAFGSGASGTVFGSRGSANFLTKLTAWLAAAFFIISLALAYLVNGTASHGDSIVDQLPAAAPAAAPATPDAAAPAVSGTAAGSAAPVAAPAGNAPTAPAAAPVVPDVGPASKSEAAPAAGEAKPATPKVPD